MSRDIYIDHDDNLQTADTDVYKGENILRIQVGTLVYAQELGIDLARFIDPGVSIQPETFRAYTVQELVKQGVRIETVLEKFNNVDAVLKYTAAQTETERTIA